MIKTLTALLIVSSIVAVFSAHTEAQYWEQRAIAAEAVIKVVEEYNYDFTVDVLYETDEYTNWKESK